ncbi:MAG: universal stress protein [Planctomycetota bacterium]|jgi:nucleotide-binding universal stress UspA family protein
MTKAVPDHILVPIDLSEPSGIGLKVADDLARRLGAYVTVALVENITAESVIDAIPDDVAEGFRRQHARAVATVEDFVHGVLGADHGRDVNVLDGVFVADTIVDYAQRCGADLICVSTAGRRGWRRLFLGSVTAEIVRRATVPVLTFRDRKAENTEYVFDDFRRVLLATDLGDDARVLLQQALTLASEHGEVTPVHVIEVGPDYGIYGTPFSVPAETETAAREWTETALEALLTDVNTAILRPSRVVAGRPDEAILSIEKELQPDVTVIGTHGRTGIDRMMLGSVAERVTRYATGPVLVVPTGPRRG